MTTPDCLDARAILAAYYAQSVGASVRASTPVSVWLPAAASASRPALPTPEREARIGEARRLQDQIDAAYWRFTRQARALPPSLQCPDAYDRLRDIKAR